jgi:hypothetical protein
MYLSILCIDAWQVDLGCERYLGWNVWVIWAAVDLDAVDAVFVYTLEMMLASILQ